jgi:hypothetical protein
VLSHTSRYFKTSLQFKYSLSPVTVSSRAVQQEAASFLCVQLWPGISVRKNRTLRSDSNSEIGLDFQWKVTSMSFKCAVQCGRCYWLLESWRIWSINCISLELFNVVAAYRLLLSDSIAHRKKDKNQELKFPGSLRHFRHGGVWPFFLQLNPGNANYSHGKVDILSALATL